MTPLHSFLKHRIDSYAEKSLEIVQVKLGFMPHRGQRQPDPEQDKRNDTRRGSDHEFRVSAEERKPRVRRSHGDMREHQDTALITGASSGIGMHLAEEFAKHGHPLILVAPDATELEQLAERLGSSYCVNVKVVACDLREVEAFEKIKTALEGTAVDILVNNAGHGQKGKAWEIPLTDDLSMVSLNIGAVLRLTKLLLPQMVERGHGRIMNTASVAGFQPGPGYAVYSSTKAFVLSYSESLATELQDTGVTVTALCPGPTDTDFFPKADMLQTRAFQQANLMAPQEVAQTGYNALMIGDRVVVPGLANKAMVFMRRLIPESLQAKLNEMLLDDVPPKDQSRARGSKEGD